MFLITILFRCKVTLPEDYKMQFFFKMIFTQMNKLKIYTKIYLVFNNCVK